jgi:hypothetical protein
LAVEASNKEAKRLYKIKPFTLGDGFLREFGDHTVWQALTSAGGQDMTAKVTFDYWGSVTVDVQMLSPTMPEDPTPTTTVIWEETPK